MKSVKGQLPATEAYRHLAAVGFLIRDTREAQGLSQGQLGVRLRHAGVNLSPAELNLVEYGRQALTPEQARIVERVLNLRAGRLDEVTG